ncbi:hypothetical protein FDP41_008604 [Naegleria fowleri]|uniref:Uncharacterized protein n=2 Tax=Naegleria fowleri TaxID=5763 RepID=A0A6A5BGE9_NAEFO|nr:uncharacterized protein FDP41_008604 [Naegleria fowleri]KAF0973100.1 hypothetical protein FDP41_008604 [Naegleria fowleri]
MKKIPMWRKAIQNKVAALYLLRFIRVREFKRKLLDILNYFRSIEKRLYFDHIGYLATTENASSSFIRKFFVSSDDLEKLASTDSLPLNATFRDDKYSLHLKRDVVVRDANGLKIMYDAALKDYELLEERLLKIGSYFIEKNLSSFPKLQVDRFVVLEGLLESETWFQDSKRKVIDCYMEAYEHCYEPKEQLRLASAIMQIMKKTPKFNLESHYFSESYASEIICLELYHSLLKDILKEQIRDEKDYLSFIYEAIDPSTERSGFPDNVTLDNFAQTELFPGSSKVGFLDFYTSTSIIGRIHEHLEKAVNNITNSFKFKNVLSLNAVRRSVLQQLIVEWKLIAKEEKIQKAIKSKLSEERSAIEDTNILEDPNELIFLLNTVIDTEKMPKHNTDDQENMITRDTEGGFSMAEKDSIPLQYFSNLVEMITIWKHLTKELLETDILTAIFNSQATLVGTAQQSMNSALGPLNFDTKDALNDSQHSFPEMKTQYLTNLAIVEFDSSMAEANFNSFDGIKRLVGLVGLFELRHLYQYQMLQKILYETAVKYNQTPLDDYYVAQEKKEFFVTSMNTQNDTSQYITKEVLQELFLTFNNMKIPIRQRILKEYQKLSEGIIKSKRANVVRKYLRDLKFRLSASFCTSMLSTIQPYILKCDIIDVVRELRATLGAVSVGSGFLIGKPDHNVQISSHGVVSKNKDDHANKCVMAKDGEVVNVTYVPHFIQIMRTSFIQANEEENTMTDNFYNLLQILQRTFIILKFWAISIQATAKLYDIIINEGYGLEKGLETYCKSLTSELEHLRQPENPASVISYLTLKCETLLLKYILILDNLKHKLRKEGMRSCMIAENYLQSITHEPIEDNLSESDVYVISPKHLDQEKREKYTGLDASNQNILPLKCLNNLLLELHDSERNYFSAEDANVTLYMEELLTEEKVYPNSMPEQAVKMQFDFLKTSVLMYKLRDYFLDLSCNGSKLMLQDEAKMEDLYNHIIFKKAKRIYEKQLKGLISTLEQKSTNDIYDMAIQQKAKKKKEKDLRDKQVSILFQEISKLLISKSIQDMKETYAILKKELHEMEQPPLHTEKDSFEDSKVQIFHSFLNRILTNAGKTSSKNGEAQVTINEKDLEKALEEVGQKIQEWKTEYIRFLEYKSYEVIDHLKRSLFTSEQKVKFLLYKRDVDRKSLKRRIDAEVDDKNYDLVFLVNNILWKNKELEHQLKEVKSQVRNELIHEYEDLVRNLYKELVSTNGKVAKFKKDFLQNLDQRFYEVRENTFFEIATQKDIGDASFKKKALEVAMEDSELNKLRRENEDLKVQHTQEKEDEALKDFYASKYEVGLRENQLRQELLKTQQQLSNAEMEVEQLRKDLQLQIKNKQKLVNWKVKNAQLLEELEEKVEKYERWSHTNVDKLLLELEEKKREAGHYEKLKERMKEKTNAIDFKNQKTIETLKKKLAKEQAMKSKLMEQLESMKENYEESSWQAKYWQLMNELQQVQKENASLKIMLETKTSFTEPNVDSELENPPIVNLDGNNAVVHTTPSPPSSGRKTASPSTLLRPISEGDTPAAMFLIENAPKKRPSTGAVRARAANNNNNAQNQTSTIIQQQLQQFKKVMTQSNASSITNQSTPSARPLTVLPTYGKGMFGGMPLQQKRRAMSAGTKTRKHQSQPSTTTTTTAYTSPTTNMVSE